MNSLDHDREPAQSAPAHSRWGRATSDVGEEAREALRELAGSYDYCVYAWWRRAGREAEPAMAATLAVFDRWLGASPPQRTDSGSERMRTWLAERLVELNEEDLEAPVASSIALDPEWSESRYADEPPGEPDAIFQRRWALTVLEFTVATMRAEYTARGEEALFPELLPFAGFDSGEDDRYAGAAERTGRTVGAMHKEVYDFRQRQRELLLYFAGDTLLDPEEAGSEITALLCACDAPGPEASAARLPTEIGHLPPDQMLSRAMQSVRMTRGGADGWQPPTVAEAARLFPQYEVSALLGRGGMGAVYQGRQTELDRLVAIKLLPLEVSVDRDFADRFRREARAMAKLQHPNIIDVHDFGTTTEGHLYFVMEYVDGTNLDAMIRGPGLEPAQALHIIGSVCDALAYAHAEGVVHRDIKPANVMVGKKGRVKVADFGLARLTDSGPEQLGHTVTDTVMGTPDYMAPEQKRGMNVDHRADIYSLGVMLYEMLCREVPQGIFDPPSHRVAVDSRVDQVVIKAMQQQPDRRYQSTQEMKADVDAAGTPQPLAIAPKRGALARLPLGRMSRAMTMLAPGAAPRSKKRPIFASLGVLAVGAALFYAQPWKKSAPPSPSPAPQVAASPTGPGNPGALTKTAAFGPWQPLFTEAEWKQTVPGQREVVDGRLHLLGPAVEKPQSAADGAIRARIQYQMGANAAGFTARVSDAGRYKLSIVNDRSLGLRFFGGARSSSANMHKLGDYYLPKPLQPGDTLLLELRLQRDRLIVLVDGAVVIDARDSRLTAPGEWGITAADGWFESVEVQTPLPADADGWEDLLAKLTPAVVAQTGHGWTLKDGELFSPDTKWATLPLPVQLSGISYRVRVKLRQLPSKDVFHIVLPVADRMCGFELEGWAGKYSGLGMVNGKLTKDMPGVVVGKQVKDTAPHDLEVTVRLDGANATITTTLDTRPLYAWTGPTAALSQDKYWATTAPGALALGTYVGGWAVSAVKVKRLDVGKLAAADATKEAPFVNTLGMKFVPVPIVGGPTGSPQGTGQPLVPGAATSAGKTVLFSVWETRVQDYEAFTTETKRGLPKPSYVQGPTHPAVLVSWEDATAFCTWLTERERKAGKLGPSEIYRLPSDHEWSCAAGIADREDAATTPEQKNAGLPDVYAWGSAWPPPAGAGNFNGMETEGKALKFVEAPIKDYRDDFPTTAPVGSFPPNRWGLYDLSGNVWEKCEDLFRPGDTKHVARGAAFSDQTAAKLKLSCRVDRPPDHRTDFMGFRCVLAVPAPPTAASAPSPSAADGWEYLRTPLTPDVLKKIGGGWSLEGEALRSPNYLFGRLPLGTFAGASYQVRVNLRQLVAKDGFSLLLPVGDRSVAFALDGLPAEGYFTGLNQVDGKRGKQLPGSVLGRQVKDSGPHELDVTVRLDGANATISSTFDARPLYEWTGPIVALSHRWPELHWPADTLALLTFANDWLVLEVKVKRLDSGASAPPAAATTTPRPHP